MKAIILAAGVGKRLRPFTDSHPKSLLRFGGQSLLRRHLSILAGAGVEDITVVVGHRAEQIENEISSSGCLARVRTLHNSQYKRGSALSVLTAADVLSGSDCILMDADLLYDSALITRLVQSEFRSALLVDSHLEDTDEEVKVVLDAEGRPIELGKDLRRHGRIAGESVGIFKFDRCAGLLLVERLRRMSAADANVEYETAISELMTDVEMGCVRIDRLAWIEIDYPSDVERARSEVYPRLSRTPEVQNDDVGS